MPEDDSNVEAKQDQRIGRSVRALKDFILSDPKLVLGIVFVIFYGWREGSKMMGLDLAQPITRQEVTAIAREVAGDAAKEAAGRAVEASDARWANQFDRLERKLDDVILAKGGYPNSFANLPKGPRP